MRISGRIFWQYALLVTVAATLLLPLVWAFVAALKPLDQIYAEPPEFWPRTTRWENFGDAFTRLPFARFMLNSLVIALPATAGAVLTSAMAGYAFARIRWTGRRFWQLATLAALLIPANLLLVPHFMAYGWLGWINTYKPLIVPAWLGGGAFNVLLFTQYFRTIPRELSDAARLDGASHPQILAWIILPLAKPAVATVALLSFVYHWQDFMRPLIYLADFRTYPVSLGLRMYQTTQGSWMNLVLAASLIALIPVALAFAALHRAWRAPATSSP
jgi:multiple sugar transport system permease protein